MATAKVMKTETRLKKLAALIQDQKRESFYDPEQQSDEEGLGILIAKWAGWDGEPIVAAFVAALEEANYSTLAGEVKEAYERDEARAEAMRAELERQQAEPVQCVAVVE